jgi:parvulin-like peptidyl-prolyl isomerase
MMLEYYNNHLGELSSAETAQMQIIDLPVRDFLPTSQPVEAQDIEQARRQARRQAELASAELAEGKDFGQVAKKYSKAARSDEGGLFPLMERGSFKSEEVEKAAFEQQAGQVSGIIQTNTDFYIVKTLQAAAPGQAVPFEQVQDQIEQALRDEAYQRLLGNYLKTLRTDSQRQATDKFAAACLEAAIKQYYK